MAKRRKPTRQKQRGQTRQQKQGTNWVLISGIVGGGVLLLLALLALSLQAPAQFTLAGYCAQNPDACVARGADKAAVTIVEIFDFGCPHCRDFQEETNPLISQQYIDNERIRWISLPFALGDETLPATNASLCAAEQDAYFAFTEALFSQFDQPDYLTRDSFLRAAGAVGLEMDPFTTCLQDGRYNSVIRDNIQAARRVGVNSTPHFFINERKLEGAQPFSVFQAQIDSMLNS